MRFEVVGLIAVAKGPGLKLGEILDTQDVECPLSQADCLSLVNQGSLRALAAAPEVAEARAKKGKETR